MQHTVNRRTLLRSAAASALALPFSGLAARKASALGRVEPIISPYGKIAPVKDMTTGLPLLQLPEGFSYQSFGWSGDLMADGSPTPAAHDGMAVVRSRYVNGAPEITLIRNHENGIDTRLGLISGTAVYDSSEAIVFEDQDENAATGPLAGGNTALIFADGKFTEARPVLGGTLWNCAGGPMPWGTWLTCEEGKEDFTAMGGKTHGYVFEVSANPGETSGVPIKAMGRMDHEAVAMDPFTGAIFLTEDDRNQSGLYKFIPADTSKKLGSLEQGGTLWMAKVAGEDKVDLLTPSMGDRHQLEWVQIDDPDLAPQSFTEAPHDADNMASGPFVQGRNKGALRMSRLEGCWYSASDRLVYLVDTSSGVDAEGKIGRGDGSVWTLDPATDWLSCIYQSDNRAAGNNFDNVAVSPRGGVILCEDGDEYEDEFGVGQRIWG